MMSARMLSNQIMAVASLIVSLFLVMLIFMFTMLPLDDSLWWPFSTTAVSRGLKVGKPLLAFASIILLLTCITDLLRALNKRMLLAEAAKIRGQSLSQSQSDT